MPTCTRGHSFESRYSTRAPSEEQIEAAGVDDWDDSDYAAQVLEAMVSRVYVCDICTECGLTVGVLNGFAVQVAPPVVNAPDTAPAQSETSASAAIVV